MFACPEVRLLILHRVQANDAGRIVHDIATGNINPDLVYCKIEEWDHITGSIRYGHGYPEVPSWNEVPFFKGQKKIVLRNCGLINPDDIEEYIAVGGYQALYKTLIDDKPETRHRADQGLQAARPRRRGFPDRQQVGVPAQGGGRPEVHHLQCRRRRSRRLHEPQRDRERSSLAAGRHDHRRLRDGRQPRHHLRARRISAGGASAESRASSRPANTGCWATTSWAADSTSISSWWKAPERLCAAKRRR